MPKRTIHLASPVSETTAAQAAQLRARFDAVRAEQGVPTGFPPEVLEEAK